jgi:hypothetical protein
MTSISFVAKTMTRSLISSPLGSTGATKETSSSKFQYGDK